MKRATPRFPDRRAAAFTLIEMIGVLAIMAIMASVLVPNALRSMDRAAIKAEAENLAALGEQTKQYLRANGIAPTSANWIAAIGTFSDLAQADIATNKRAQARVYLLEPATAPALPPRAMILSSMRAGLALPTAANITTSAQFLSLWQTADNAVPSTASWGGWSAWTAVANSGDYLLIERINLLPIYNTDLANVTLTLNNRGAATASYNLVLPDGTSQTAVNIVAGGNVVLTGLLPRTRLNLYSTASGGTLNYTYVVGTVGRTFDFDATNRWTPQ
jgi:type II secretory pathway pseudopilin PulG